MSTNRHQLQSACRLGYHKIVSILTGFMDLCVKLLTLNLQKQRQDMPIAINAPILVINKKQ